MRTFKHIFHVPKAGTITTIQCYDFRLISSLSIIVMYLCVQKFSSARQVVEQAFGRLKHRWRCISKRCDAGVDNAIKIIGACVTLHNVCEKRQDFFHEEWWEPPSNPTDLEPSDDFSTVDGSCVGDILKQYFFP